MEDPRPYIRAKKKVNARFVFYYHLAAYLIINLVLLIINLITSPGYLWVIWPVIGWGIGILFHALGALLFGRDTELRDRMIQKEMEKDLKKTNRDQ